MDPITTLIMLPAVVGTLATARPQYERQNGNYVNVQREERIGTEIDIGHTARASTEAKFFDAEHFGLDRRDLLLAEISLLAEKQDGWDGEGSHGPTVASREGAERFLLTLPAGVPLPTPMMTIRGEIEFFWDLPTGYADMSFDAQGVGSFFARAKDGQETFIDGMHAGDIHTEDFGLMLSCLTPQTAIKAA